MTRFPLKRFKAMEIESERMQRCIDFIKLHSWIYSRAANLKWSGELAVM